MKADAMMAAAICAAAAACAAETVTYDAKSFKLHLPPYSIAVLR